MKIVLHIGLHKTGSTAIQYFLTQNFLQLSRSGVRYSRVGIPKEANLGNHLLPASYEQDHTNREEWEALRLEVETSAADTLLISSENFSLLTADAINDIADRLNALGDVTVIVYLRNQVDLLESMWRTDVLHYHATDDIVAYIQNYKGRLDYDALLSDWNRAFSRVIVRLYDTVPPGAIVQDFCAHTGVPFDPSCSLPPEQINHGLPVESLVALQALRKSGAPEAVIGAFCWWSYNVFKEGTFVQLSSDDAEQLMRDYSKSNSAVAKKYFGCADLFRSFATRLHKPLTSTDHLIRVVTSVFLDREEPPKLFGITRDDASLRTYLPGDIGESMSRDPYFWDIWHVDDGGEDSWLTVTGWALPFDGIVRNFQILVNGTIVDRLTLSVCEEVARVFPWWPHASLSQFEARVRKTGHGELTFTVAAANGDTRQGNTYSRCYNYLPGFPANVPGQEIGASIGETGNPLRYRIAGRTLFRGFERVLRYHGGTSFDQVGRILDWGCGPGRIAAHLIAATPVGTVSGVDIAASSIEWARSVYPNEDFTLCGTRPPLPYDDQSFGLVLAFSVLTHVPNDLIHAWVKEMHRLLKPDALFLATVLGETAFAKLNPQVEDSVAMAWMYDGVDDSAQNSQLSGTGVDDGYYRNTFMTKAHVKSVVDALFDVVEVIDNFYVYQDLWVLKRRAQPIT